MKRLYFWFIAIVLIVTMVLTIGFAGCKTETEPVEEAMEEEAMEEEAMEEEAMEEEAMEEEPVTIIHFTDESGPYPTIFSTVIENFTKKYPNVTVDKQVIGWGEFESTLAGLIASGEPPDVIRLEPGGPYVAQVLAEAIIDISPYLEADSEWKNSIFPIALDLMRVDGKVYGSPYSMNNMQLMVNKSLLEEYGLKEPETTDDLIEMAAVLEGTGIAPITFGFSDKWTAVDLFVVLVRQQGGGELMNKADLGEASWNEPVFIETMEAIKSFNESGVAFPGANAMSWHEDALPNWIQGNSVMLWCGGNWMIPDIPEEMNGTAIWFPNLPGEERVLTGGVAGVVGISSGSKNIEWAVKYIKEFSTPEAREILFSNGVAPAGPLEGDEAESAYPIANKVNSEQGDALDRRIYTPEIYEAIAAAIQLIFAGDISPEEAMNQIQNVSAEVYGE